MPRRRPLNLPTKTNMLTEPEKQSLVIAGHAIYDEALRARANFSRFNSLHEAAAVLREEHDELWEAIKRKRPLQPAAQSSWREQIRREAIQTGAMALRLVAELDGVAE